ncbi:MAG: hypothetical protein ACRCWF_11005 [Beijerinckiaceae bacterium]
MTLRLIFAVPGLLLTAAIIWAFGKANLWTSGAAMLADPWGLVALVDLYAGFIFTGVIIAAIERWKPWSIGMIVLSMGLGNVVFAVWGAVRGAEMLRSLASR